MELILFRENSWGRHKENHCKKTLSIWKLREENLYQEKSFDLMRIIFCYCSCVLSY
jgi:hypothetical protein